MIYEKICPDIDYEAHGLKKGDREVYIETYVPTPSCPNVPVRPAVIIFPGGGYGALSPREAEPIAHAFNAQGYAAFVLWYTISPGEFPCALLEAAWTVDHVRKNAEKWYIDPNKILVCGFSAGGHLAASIGTLWDSPEVRDVLGFKNKEARPNGMMLSYPVISSGEFIEHGSFNNLLGSKAADSNLRARLSLENAVTSETPPAFIWHTAMDPLVPVENSLLMASALSANSVPFELHILPHGWHGLALCRPQTGETNLLHWISNWTEHAAKWVETL